MKTGQSHRLIGFIVMVMAVATAASADYQGVLKSAQQLAGGKESPQNSQIVDGLKEALQVGTENAVKSVSRLDGYYKNLEIKIILPQYVKNAETVLRAAGMGATLDEFEQSMNRTAEKAAPQALFMPVIRNPCPRSVSPGPIRALSKRFRASLLPAPLSLTWINMRLKNRLTGYS